jgi:hypothetical protein
MDAEPKNIGLIASGALALGVFMPIVSIPFLGSINYIQNGTGDGVFILIAAGAGAFFSYQEQRKGMIGCAIVSLLIMAYTFISFRMKMSQLTSASGSDDSMGELGKGLADALAQSVQMQWGWVILIAGAVALLFAGIKTES